MNFSGFPYYFGWIKDDRDERDLLVKTKRIRDLPERVDLSHLVYGVRNQLSKGACVGFGTDGILSGEAKAKKAFTEPFSPDWIYNGARLAIGKLHEDYGCYPRDAMTFIHKCGCLLDHFHPYTDFLDTTDPTTWECAPEARKWPIVSYERCVDGIEGICTGLASGHLVFLGTPWWYAWLETDERGVLLEDYKPGALAGGHGYFAYGYDTTLSFPDRWYCTGGILCQNSWGYTWGNKGRMIIPWTAPNNWKMEGGYDAYIVQVDWVPIPSPSQHKRWLEFLLRYSNNGKTSWTDKGRIRIPLP